MAVVVRPEDDAFVECNKENIDAVVVKHSETKSCHALEWWNHRWFERRFLDTNGVRIVWC